MRRLLSALIAAAFIFSLAPTVALAQFDGEITSNCAVLADAETGTVLYEKNGDQRAYPASTTKLLTALVVVDRVADLEEYVTVGPEVWRFSDANILIGLVEHEEIRVIDLLYGMLLPSGNDAAAALACYVGGSIEGFAELMNLKAKEIGMDHSHFVNPHGLNNDDHYTTAEDMAKLAVEFSKNELLMEIVGTYSYTIPETNRSGSRTVTNTNKFLSGDMEWDCVTGMKTGNTSAAKYCLVTSAEQNGVSLVAIILGDSSSNGSARWTETRELLEYGFDNYSTMGLDQLNLDPVSVEVSGCSRNDAEGGLLTLEYDYSGAKLVGFAEDLDEIKANAASIEVVYSYPSNVISAPVSQGDVLGTAAITYEGETIAVVNLLASRDVLAEGDSALMTSAAQLTPAPTGGASTGGGFPVLAVILIVCAAVAGFAAYRLLTSKKRRHTSKRAMKKSYYVYKGK